jgi:WD40 repeat protein
MIDFARIFPRAGKKVARLDGHGATVLSASFSPDGGRVVTASEDNTARVWDAATGKEVTRLDGHGAIVLSASFSPDGARRHGVGRQHGAGVGRGGQGRRSPASGHSDFVTIASFSPDRGRVVTASLGETARVWNAATGKEVARLVGHLVPIQ